MIVGVNGKPVRRLADLAEELERAGVGKRVALAIKRDGRDMSIDVEVMDIGRKRLTPALRHAVEAAVEHRQIE